MTKTGDDLSTPSRARTHPKQLSDADAVFLSVERPEAPSHIAGLTILDPSGRPEFCFEHFLEIFRERIELVARFKWKLFEPPLGLDRAYWVEAEDFDVADHVHRVAVANPGDRAALAKLAGVLHAQPLDRSRPLWESWWIEGLEGQRVATLLKIHHCLMDGQSGMGLSEVLMDLSPEPTRGSAAPEEVQSPQPRRPNVWEMGRAALTNGFRIPRAIAEHSRRAVTQRVGRVMDESSANRPPRVPRVRFNGRLTGHRSFTFATIPLGPLRDVKKHFDVTMNDVLLAIVGSSLRQGLIKEGDLPHEPIVGLCPVSLRRGGDKSFGNQISSMPVSLATNLESASKRLMAIHASAEAAKRRLEDGAFETFAALSECLVPGALRLLTRAAHGIPSLLPLPANLVISNVRGLPVPMYLAGARVEELYPMSMLQVANGMNVTVISHDGRVDFGFLVDSKLVRDPWVYADGVHTAYRELEAVVLAHSKTCEPDAASALPAPVRSGRESGSNSEDSGPQEPDASPAFDVAPLDLQLMISELRHLRAPSRMSATRDETANPE